MSSQLVDTARRRLRVTRVVLLKNRSNARQPVKKAPPLTSRRHLRVEEPHFHNEIFPDSAAPTWQSVPITSALCTSLLDYKRNPIAHVSKGRDRLRTTCVAVAIKPARSRRALRGIFEEQSHSRRVYFTCKQLFSPLHFWWRIPSYIDQFCWCLLFNLPEPRIRAVSETTPVRIRTIGSRRNELSEQRNLSPLSPRALVAYLCILIVPLCYVLLKLSYLLSK